MKTYYSAFSLLNMVYPPEMNFEIGIFVCGTITEVQFDIKDLSTRRRH